MTVSSPLVSKYLREFDTHTEAYEAAKDESTNTAGQVLSATLFEQGGRFNMSLAMTMADLTRFVRRDSAPARGELRSRINRPLMTDHAKSIETYLLSNSDSYILPSVTLTLSTPVSVFTIRSPAPLRSAWVVLRSDTQFQVTDGQHRLVALSGASESKGRVTGALAQNPKLGRDGVAVHIVFEDDVDRIHQDFADAARTKQIPASMLAAYNMREPFNKVLSQIVDGSDLLRERVDESSKTLGKRSQKLFLLNQVRGFLKELIMADYAATEDAVARVASQQLRTGDLRDDAVKRAVELIHTLSAQMKPWTEIIDLRPDGPEANKIPVYREEYLNVTATGLNIIGRVGHVVFTYATADPQLRRDYIDRLAKLDWKRSSPFWAGNVIAEGTTKLLTQRGPVDAAFHKVRKEIGIPSDWLPARMRKKYAALDGAKLGQE